MPVDGGAIVDQIVANFDLQSVSPACTNPGPGVRGVEDFALSIEKAIWRERHIVDFEIILRRRRSDV